MKDYVADFETTVSTEKTRVWAYGLCEVGNVEKSFQYGNNIDDFFKWCAKKENKNVYFHNLKFDGQFIIHWLLSQGFEWVKDRKELRDKTFTGIISSQGAFYSIEVVFKKYQKKYNKVQFLDSHKKLPFKVDVIGKAFGLPVKKLEVAPDFYTRHRAEDHELTSEEIDYLRNDVFVVAMALGIQMEQGLTRMTVGSDALNGFKDMMGKTSFNINFPVMDNKVDDEIRKAYRGGFTYVNPRYAGKDIADGLVYDVTSLYPSIMYYKDLPYSYPQPFNGKYEYDEDYPLYIQELFCEFTLKEDKIPTIQLKNGGRFVETEYIRESGVEPVMLHMTNVDLELFFDHYDVYVHEWGKGLKFKKCQGVFKGYIDYWIKVKEENTGVNESLRTLAKLMLNSLYGKFASNPNVTGKYPVLENGIVKYKDGEEDIVDPVYTAMGVFITSYAREQTIRTAQSVFHRFIYADTDSIHIEGSDVPDNVDIDPLRMGAWKFEGGFTKARFIRAKTYIEEMKGKLHVTCAGMPDNVKEHVTWENFRKLDESMLLPARDGYWFGKLTPKRIEGGVVLTPSPFKIN